MRKILCALALVPSFGFADANMPYCAESVVTVLLDEITELGFSARDLLDLTSRPRHALWSWDYKEDVTELSLRVASVARTARYIDSVAVYPEGAPDIAVICPDRVEVDAWVHFSTSDGAFAERWNTTIFATDGTDCHDAKCKAPGTLARFSHQFSRDHLNGNFYGDVPVLENQTFRFFAEGSFSNDAFEANVFGQAYGCDNDVCYSDYLRGGHSL